MKLAQLTELARNAGLTTFNQSDIVASVGTSNGHVYDTVKTSQLTSMVHLMDVLWIELRPYNEAFEPKGHSPLPKAVRSVNSDFSQWVLTRNDDEEDTTEYGQEQADAHDAEMQDIADSYEMGGW